MEGLLFAFGLLDIIDIILLVLLAIFNGFIWNKKADTCAVQGVIIFLFGIVFPVWSMSREIYRNTTLNGPALDNFELLYVYMLLPV